jgi:endonuclease/exonuclease/phosphatase family metal-dependent hydrolase
MKRTLVVLAILICCIGECHAIKGLRVMFYNVENYFDCKHDSLKNDYEFLPGGIRAWTPARFWVKTGHIARVIAAIGADKFPEIVGLAEVENEACLKSLIYVSPLKNAGYSFIHEESPDSRGVDVCLLYNRYLFSVIRHVSIRVNCKEDSTKRTRDILYVCGKTYTNDTLHLFVTHFPSRLGGELESEAYRRDVAKLIREKADSIFSVQEKSNILIMGDFNDYPDCRSVSVDLQAGMPAEDPECKALYNLMLPMDGKPDMGTNKYQGDWGILDQMLVSGNLLKHTREAHIFDADFLLVPDERWMGRKPYRTYNGMIYQGGYSDHLPVYLDMDFYK